MPAMPTIEQLVQSIDRRVKELSREIASLEDARSALTANGSAPTPSHQPRRKPAARRRPARTTKVLTAQTAERMLAESDGLTTAVLATKAGAGRDQVLALLRDLEKANRVRRTGQRRSTRWHAITDEERTQKRAAELKRRSRRRSTLS
jgi:cell division septum initiation protein DivIVA